MDTCAAHFHRIRLENRIKREFYLSLEFICPCEELWQRGLHVEPHAYQHHVFMDWRFVDDEKWAEVHKALNGGGVDSMQAKWDEMFGVKEEIVEEEKPKKPRKKTAVKKTTGKKPAVKRKSTSEKGAKKVTTAKKKKETSKKAE